jgi:hypothetical protein
MIRKNLRDDYSPLYFLAALGAGGIAITFFIYLTFLVAHPQTPIVTFDQLWPIVTTGNRLAGGLVGLAVLGIAFFTLMHLRLLVWNLIEFKRFRRTPSYARLLSTNQEVTLMTVPLTLAMTINVLFATGAVFVPGLWSVVEYLFPIALVAFGAAGYYAIRLYARYFTRVISHGQFDFADNNNLGQLVAVFAFAMVGVGLAAPAAMSQQLVTSTIGILGAVFFITAALVLGMLKLVMGFKSMLSEGIAPAAAPSLWIVIPILTLLGIALIRVDHGLAHGFGLPLSPPNQLVFTGAILSLQLLFGILGYSVMQRVGYFRDFVRGDQRHPGAYALICPGVALFVFSMFFIHLGLVRNGLIEFFSIAHFVAMAPLLYLQWRTIATFIRLNERLLRVPGQSLDRDLLPVAAGGRSD